MSQPSETFGNFDLVKKVKLDFTDVCVSKWRSRVTGLSVIHLDYDAPIVNGYFVVPTEIFNDSGCPHTLEHLIFMGSEKYPHKGVLDLLANRGFSNGTNAWTDTDHTAYTISTAGEQGFLQLLPIYIDHILYPTITQAGFVTEVHHIDGKGHDSGVVYSEMQGRENTSGDLVSLKLQRLVEPVDSAYRSETGGLMEALRVLSAEQIRDYHSNYYVPHNLSLVITGKFTNGTASVLKVLQDQVEPTIIAHGQNAGPRPPGWKRPFLETSSALRQPITHDLQETVEFPEKDESVGELVISFTGPSPNDYLTRKAIDVLSSYLTSSAVAPLNKEYIETESPLCSYIYFAEDSRVGHCDLPIYIGSVPSEHLDSFPDKLKASLQRIIEGGIDMQRVALVINRDERQLRSKLEAAKGDQFSGNVIDDILYGAADGSQLLASMDEIKYYNILRGWSAQQWADVLTKYYIEAPRATVIGKPSSALADKLEKDEKDRLAAQVAALGPEGLKKAQDALDVAKKEHDAPIPKGVITSFPVPGVNSISWIPAQHVQEPGKGRAIAFPNAPSPLAEHLSKDEGELPFFVHYAHVKSDFTALNVFISLADLPKRLRPHISVYSTAFFSLPLNKSDGTKLTHEEVVNQLDDQTVGYEASLGIEGGFTELFRIFLKTETYRYETVIEWAKELLYNTEFTKERLQVAVAKIQQSIPELKRDGSTVLSSVWANQLYTDGSTSKAGTILNLAEFIPKIAAQLQEDPDAVIADFEEIRRHLTNPANIRFVMFGNVLDLENPKSIWAKHFSSKLTPAPLSAVPLASQTLNSTGRKPARKATVMSLPTIESSFVTYTTKGISGFNHPDFPVIRLAQEVLNGTESYFWRYIRGSGLAYGAYASMDIESGLLSFTLYRSSNCMQAFEEAGKVVRGLVDGSIEFDKSLLDAAKSTIVFATARSMQTAGKTALSTFVNEGLKGVPATHKIDLLKYQDVTPEQVLDALKKHFLPLFDPATSVAAIVTAPGKADETTATLKKLGYEVTQKAIEIDPEEDSGGMSDSESCSSTSSGAR